MDAVKIAAQATGLDNSIVLMMVLASQVKDYYPELYFFYSDFQVTAERSDIFRYLALDKFGGYYADMDIEPLKSLDDLLNITGNPGCILALEPEVHAIMIYNKYHMIGNAFMASRPGHALWRYGTLRKKHVAEIFLQLTVVTGL